MIEKKKKHLLIGYSTHKRLLKEGEKNESFDHVINRLLDELKTYRIKEMMKEEEMEN